jgi:hypothetical protein
MIFLFLGVIIIFHSQFIESCKTSDFQKNIKNESLKKLFRRILYLSFCLNKVFEGFISIEKKIIDEGFGIEVLELVNYVKNTMWVMNRNVRFFLWNFGT